MQTMKNAIKILILFILLTGCANASPTQSAKKTQATVDTFKNTIISLTFDDGAADDYSTRALLAQYNLHATFYIVSGFTNTDGYMTTQQLHDLYADGNEIGGHTLSHPDLSAMSGVELKNEICQDRDHLISEGFNVTSFAYPFGHYNNEARKTAADCGYASARGVSDGPEIIPPADLYVLKAMPYIVKESGVEKMMRYITSVNQDGGGWAIFVFHHVCDGCSEFSIKPDNFSRFISLIAEQRQNGLMIKTVNEVISGR